jgi:hypothetical protein
MIMIERQNILDLIGKYRGRYSSCIITTYTFDFAFFEERIMSILRTSNIKNVNVFLDGKYLANQNENTTGNEFKTHKTYSLNPIYETGVFHPKIMLLTGPKNGLLIIGSGNLTTSGLSTNDEIWGDFHLKSIESPNAPLFAATWKYLQQYFSQAKGFNLQKLNWITQRSPWLNEIINLPATDFISINNELEIKFIANSVNQTTYQELVKSLPDQPIRKLTIISPFFDEKGMALEQFSKDFKIKEFVCITDTQFGLLPTKLDDGLSSQIQFYNWMDCLDGFDKRFNRLHAKIFHFEFENGWEYLLIGSANATFNALGSSIIKPKNAEAGILLRRKMKTGYLNELGISTKNATPIELKSNDRKKTNIGDNIPDVKYDNQIICAEIINNKLSIFFKKEPEKQSEIVVLNDENNVIEKHPVEIQSKEIKIFLEKAQEPFKVCLFKSGVRITNFCLIHDIALQAKCNPDPNQEVLGQIIETISADPENATYMELLSYADYNWVDEEFENKKKKSFELKNSSEKVTENKTYEKLTEKEFNQLESIQSIETNLLNNSSVQIADILNIVSRGLLVPKRNTDENTEEILSRIAEKEQTGAGDDIKQKESFHLKSEQEIKSIQKHFSKIIKFYSSQLDSFYRNHSFNTFPSRPLSIIDLSNVSIALDLMVIYYGKKYDLTRTEFAINFNKDYIENIAELEKKYKLKRFSKTNPAYKDWAYYDVVSENFKNVKKDFTDIRKNSKDIHKSEPKLWVEMEEYLVNTYSVEYFSTDDNSEEGKSYKEYILNLLGSFLINSNIRAGYKKYDYDLLNDKIQSLRKSIFEHGTFLCLNMNWKENEIKYRDILFLDLLHFVYPISLTLNEIETININLITTYDKAKFKHKNFSSNLQNYKNLQSNYLKCKDLYKFDPNDPVRVIKTSALNSFLFAKEIGFCLLREYSKEFLIIEKPGLKWDSSLKANANRVIYPKSQIKVYSI